MSATHPDFGVASGPVDVQRYVVGREHVSREDNGEAPTPADNASSMVPTDIQPGLRVASFMVVVTASDKGGSKNVVEDVEVETLRGVPASLYLATWAGSGPT